jgi:hypothetical protein
VFILSNLEEFFLKISSCTVMKSGACLVKGSVILLNILFWCSTLKHLLKNIKVTVKSCLVDKEVPAGICVIDDDVTFELFA